MRRIKLAMSLVASLFAAPSFAQQNAAQSWVSFTTGFGPAAASMRGDTIYEGSGQVYAVLAYVRLLSTHRAVAIEGVGGRPFASGDCIPGFTICAPPFNFVGTSVSVLTRVGGPVAPDRFSAGLGAGLFRVAPSESHAVSPRPAVALHTRIEYPLVVGSRAAFVLGLRGMLFPSVHGQTLGMGLLSAGLRTW